MNRTTLVAIALAAAPLGCGGSKAKSLSAEEKSAMVDLVRDFDVIQKADEGRRLTLAAEAMSETVAKGDACFDSVRADASRKAMLIGKHCAIGCNAKAGEAFASAPPFSKFEVLLQQCGPEHLGLTAETASLACLDIFFANRIGKQLAPLYERADADLRKQVDSSLANLTFPVPIPSATSGLPLPRASNVRPIPRRVHAFLRVTANGGLHAGNLPRMRIRPGGIAIDDGLLGDDVAAADLGARLAQLSGAPAATSPTAPAPPATPNVVAGRRLPRSGQVLDEAQPLVLILADRDAPAAAVIDAIGQSPGALLAVARERIPEALAVPLIFDGPGDPLPADVQRPAELIVALDDSAAWSVVTGAGDVSKVQRINGEIDYEALRKLVQTMRASPLLAGRKEAIVRADGKATVQELVAVIDLLTAAGVEAVGLEHAPATRDIAAPPPDDRLSAGPSAPTGQIRIANATIDGDLDKNIIRRYIRRKLPALRACYEDALAAKPHLSLDLVAKFTIAADGYATGASTPGIKGELGDCVAGVLESIQFPKPKSGTVDVRYTFQLRPAPEE